MKKPAHDSRWAAVPVLAVCIGNCGKWLGAVLHWFCLGVLRVGMGLAVVEIDKEERVADLHICNPVLTGVDETADLVCDFGGMSRPAGECSGYT